MRFYISGERYNTEQNNIHIFHNSHMKLFTLLPAAESSLKGAEYLPLRRSVRKSKAELLKEQNEKIEANLSRNDDSELDIEICQILNKGRVH